MTAFVVVTTCPTKASAQKLAKEIVHKKLAACAQISSPIQSFFHWKGKIEQAREFQIWLKTSRKNYHRLEKAILKLHPYEVPEILALEVKAGHRPYIKWLAE